MSRLHHTRAWRKLRDQVVREEPVCQLQLPGVCTTWSQTGDHIAPASIRPDLFYERTNVRGACHACNYKRSDTPDDDLDQLRRPAALTFFDDDDA